MMDQTNVDYLFQVTAALAERSPTNLSAAGHGVSTFGAHFAKASISSGNDTWNRQEQTYRPVERSVFEPDPGGAYATEMESESAGAGRAETASYGDSEDDAALANPASDTNNPTELEAESNREESREPDEETDQDAVGLETSLTHGAEAADTAAETVTDLTIGQSAAGAGESTGPSEPSNQSSAAGEPDGLLAGSAATDPGGGVTSMDAGKSDLNSATNLGKLPQVDSELETNPHGSAGKPNAESTKRDAAPATAASDTQNSVPPYSSANAVSAGSQTGETTKTATSRRTAGKSRASENSERRKSEGNQALPAQRNETAGVANQVAVAAIVNIASGDGRSAQSANSGDESKVSSTQPVGLKSDILSHAMVRAQRGHAAGRGTQADSDSALPRIDATRFVGRVAKAIQTATERGGALQLRLSPPELGSLRLQLTVDNGVMSATLEADSSATRQVLLDHLPALRERLADQNIRIERFDVDVRQDGSGSQADPRASQHEQSGERPHHANRRQPPGRPHNGDEMRPEPVITSPRATNGGINVFA